jgi:long-subunit fatty acid transport protein
MNTATAEIKNQAGPRLSTGLKYIFQTYQGPGGEMFTDYKDHGGVLSADYRLTPITTLTPSVSFNRRQFQHEEADDSKDYKSYGGSIGISQQLFTRLTGSINGGYVQRDYDQSGIPKEKSATYGAGLAARLTEFSKLDINYQHDIKDTFYALDNSVLLANSPFLLNEAIATLVSTNYRYIETDRIVSNLAYNLTDKDTVNVGFTYLWANSGTENLLPGSPVQDEDLDEKTYTVGLGYSRKLTKWVSLDLNSVYGSRKSNLRGDYDYKSYGGGASLNIAF